MKVENFRRINVCICLVLISLVQINAQHDDKWEGKFEQLGSVLPTPNVYRSADGSPGPAYWQQRADYKMTIELDEVSKSISGKQIVTYYNNSPHSLSYIWLQLDQNKRAPNSDDELTSTFNMPDSLTGWEWNYYMKQRSRICGINIIDVTEVNGNSLSYHIEKTMMRIDLVNPLLPGEKFMFKTSWQYNLNNRMEERGRSGFEYFPNDDNYVFTIAQFYPRLAVYDDFEGWQHKQFLGAGEFALTFGNFEVDIIVPDDHLLMATGQLQNPKKVLSKQQYKRYLSAFKSFDEPMIIVSQDEAIENEKERSNKLVTWKFKAESVRDFGFACSRKFIWDAQALKLGDRTILAQSLYPKEGNPLWEKESTKAVINTLKTYSKYSFVYPYPHATSIHAAAIGMEYPMICFNFGRPNDDGTYTDAVKFNMIGVIIHEVGHNYFPMIVNSDERQWTWMDEGINSFLEYLTEQECYDNFPSSRGPATSIIPYMRLPKGILRPIMTNSEQVINLGYNAYGKPATALNILRETILGSVTFDKALQTFSNRWAFKHPKPADFFRTMEDVSGIDLDWFWKGWFYSVNHVDISIDSVIWYRLDNTTNNTAISSNNVSGDNNIEDANSLHILNTPDVVYWEFKERLDDEKVRANLKAKEIYKIKFKNIGGLVMPLIIEFEYESGKKELRRIPAEIWRKNEYEVNKVFVLNEKIKAVRLDPFLETADTNTENNAFILN